MRMLTIGDAARRLNLAVDTVRRLERDGILRAERTLGGHRRFREDLIEAYLRGQRPTARAAAPVRVGLPTRPAPAEPATIFNDPLYADEPIIDESEDPENDEDCPEDEDFRAQEAPTAPAPYSPPRRWVSPRPPPEVPTMKQPTRTDEEAARLKRYKAHGVSCIPYDVPASWRATVIAELETFVTAARFPDWVTDSQATRIVHGHVQEVLKPQRDQAAHEAKQAALRAEEAAEEAKRQKLIEDGNWHARVNTMNGWDEGPAEEAREAIEEALRAEVRPNWSQRRVRELVDEILSEWDDAED